MRTRLFSLATLILVSMNVNLGLTQQRSVLMIDYDRAPRDWREAADRSQLIAVVHLKNRTFRQVQLGSNPRTTQAMTDFRADVIEVIKNVSPNFVDRAIVISRAGGILETPSGSKLVQEAYFPPWNVGTKLLLFLSWSEKSQTYTLIGGPNAAFEHDLNTNRARTSGPSTFSKGQNGRVFEDMLAEVRAAAHR